jgi:hypothetical protein
VELVSPPPVPSQVVSACKTSPDPTTNMSAHNSPTKTPSRRALGELTPRAINTPSKHLQALDPLDATRARSPLKQVQTLSPHVRAGKENVSQPVALKAGRKRTIGEVDGVENAERVGILFGRAQTGLSGVLDVRRLPYDASVASLM